jgi:UDP-3-O-[3-hydroxymyristoyl] glucosamine N-acyltransferase
MLRQEQGMKKRLRELAEWVGGTVIGDGEVEISGVAAIEEAKPGEITFIANPKYVSKLNETHASAVIVSTEITQANRPLLLTLNPYLAFARIFSLYSQKTVEPKGVDPRAWVGSTAELGKDLTIYPFVYVGERCRIEDRVTLYPGVHVGEDCSVGEDSILYPNVSIYPKTVIGKRVILHSGVVVGSDGFGYAKEGRKNVKVPQVGRVEIEDDVEIGANTTIDRGTLGCSIIRRGVKIDNLVQIAHNVVIGEDSIVVAQVGISGSTTVGSNVTLAGQAGLVGHIHVGDNVMVGGQSGVSHDLPPNSVYTGSPAIPHRDYLKMAMTLPKVPEMRRTLAEIERRLIKLETMISPEKKEK